MTENEWDFVFVAKVSDPIPAEYAFRANDDIVEEWENQFEKQFGFGFDVFVDFCFPFLVKDTDVHFSGMQVDTAIVLMLLIVESHSIASFHRMGCGLGVNQFYNDDVSEATRRGIFRARMGR
jgi:hypothetical protein